MTEKDYKENIQYTYNAYCRIVIRHASIDAARMLFAKLKREIFLEYLSEEKFMPFCSTAEFFAQPPMDEDYPFAACGHIQLALHQIQQEMEVIVHEQTASLRNDCKGA